MINFTLCNDYELDNIITKQVIAYQRSRVLITLSRNYGLTCLLFWSHGVLSWNESLTVIFCLKGTNHGGVNLTRKYFATFLSSEVVTFSFNGSNYSTGIVGKLWSIIVSKCLLVLVSLKIFFLSFMESESYFKSELLWKFYFCVNFFNCLFWIK